MSKIVREMTQVQPKYKGMKLIKMVWMKLSDIDRTDKSNTGRKNPTEIERVLKIQSCIVKGNYLPYNYEPPMVELINGKYVLLTGNHRFQAHFGAGEKEMWVAVVEFATKRARDAAKNLENAMDTDIDFGKKERTPEDIVNSAAQILTDLHEGGYDINEKLIVEVLKNDLKVTEKKERDPMVAELLKNWNVVNIVHNWTTDEVKAHAKEEVENFKTVVTQMYRKIGDGTKADWRGFEAVMKKKEEYGVDFPVNLYTFYTELDEKEIEEARLMRDPIFKGYEAMIVNWAKMIKSKNYTAPNIVEVPQIPKDFS